MNLATMKNTKDQGIIRFITIPDKENGFLGVCLDFDIVISGENRRAVMDRVQESAMGHLSIVVEKGLSDSLLNRKAPMRYWDIYEMMNEHTKLRARKAKETKEQMHAALRREMLEKLKEEKLKSFAVVSY